MATGGYKLIRFSWQGGRTDAALDRCIYILHGFCSAIVNANVGWSWDTDVNDGTANSYRTMGGHTSASPNIAYVLKHTSTGHTYRLCIGYNYNEFTALRDQDLALFQTSNSGATSKQLPGTLYVGISRDCAYAYDSTYGYIPSNTGIALKWCPLGVGKFKGGSFALANVANVLYSYFFYCKGEQFGFFCRTSTWIPSNGFYMKGFLSGEIFKDTAHSSDDITFGAVYLSGLPLHPSSSSASHTGENGTTTSIGSTSLSDHLVLINSTSVKFYASNQWTDGFCQDQNMSQIITATGDIFAGYDYSTKVGSYIRWDSTIVSGSVSSTALSPGGRWTPCYMYIGSADQDTYGVVPGDGFKGFLDTDLIRGVNYTYQRGQLLGVNGDFVYLGGGIAIGWDSSNTETFF